MECRRTLQGVAQAVDLARRVHHGQEGALRIGFFAGGMTATFPFLIQAFREQFPHVQLSMHEMTPAQQWQALTEGHIDVGFTRRLEPEFRSELRSAVLRHDPMMAILPRHHRALCPGQWTCAFWPVSRSYYRHERRLRLFSIR